MTLHVPSLLATEIAKCSRAVNSLRICVRERDRAHVRAEEAAVEEKEASATVEVGVTLPVFVCTSSRLTSGRYADCRQILCSNGLLGRYPS